MDIIEAIGIAVANEPFNNTWNKYTEFICSNRIEMWKEIKDFPNYQVSTLGRVRVVGSKRVGEKNVGLILKPSLKGVIIK